MSECHMSRDRMSVALQAAREAGFFIKKSLGKVQKISRKGDINLVTDVDTKAERLIIAKIARRFSGDSILSEECGARARKGDYRWIIDPLDGTTNFFRSFPFFSVSIAIEKGGDVECGVVYDPLRDELFSAERGKGAFLNKKAIRVSGVRRLSDAFLATGFAYNIWKSTDTNVTNFRNFLMRSLAIRRAGSAALDLAYVACGRFDGFWELDLHPWDTAAGQLIVAEAGGTITKFDGTPYSCMDNQILASNSRIHKKMISVLTKR